MSGNNIPKSFEFVKNPMMFQNEYFSQKGIITAKKTFLIASQPIIFDKVKNYGYIKRF